jgi:hypothetical protein
VNWQNDDDEWVELSDPDVVVAGTTSKPTPTQKPRSNQVPEKEVLYSRHFRTATALGNVGRSIKGRVSLSKDEELSHEIFV